ncbi:MAG: hypothetical protein Q4A15_13360 [Prevotellaceae bacterium]|nr:hypothetical protein [Prevotellaceae bacterium]
MRSKILTAITSIVLAIVCAGCFGSYDSNGYEFVKRHLKFPNSTEMIRYADKASIRSQVKELYNYNLPQNVEAECYIVKSQNDFGEFLTAPFVCFFVNGKPVYCEQVELQHELQIFSNWTMIKTAIKINTGIEL